MRLEIRRPKTPKRETKSTSFGWQLAGPRRPGGVPCMHGDSPLLNSPSATAPAERPPRSPAACRGLFRSFVVAFVVRRRKPLMHNRSCELYSTTHLLVVLQKRNEYAASGRLPASIFPQLHRCSCTTPARDESDGLQQAESYCITTVMQLHCTASTGPVNVAWGDAK